MNKSDEEKTPDYFSCDVQEGISKYYYKDKLIITIHPYKIQERNNNSQGVSAIRYYELNYLEGAE
jgi:hypothetical protein